MQRLETYHVCEGPIHQVHVWNQSKKRYAVTGKGTKGYQCRWCCEWTCYQCLVNEATKKCVECVDDEDTRKMRDGTHESYDFA